MNKAIKPTSFVIASTALRVYKCTRANGNQCLGSRVWYVPCTADCVEEPEESEEPKTHKESGRIVPVYISTYRHRRSLFFMAKTGFHLVWLRMWTLERWGPAGFLHTNVFLKRNYMHFFIADRQTDSHSLEYIVISMCIFATESRL